MTQFENLVFEGGGVKGIAYAGALIRLEREGILNHLRRTAGASAGAITAALLALGARGETLRKLVVETPFAKFMDDSAGFLRDAFRMWKHYGWYPGKFFESWIQQHIFELSGNSDLTFLDLQKLARAEPGRFIELYVTGTDLSGQCAKVYSADNTPDMPIWKALRISMSIPLFFAAVREEKRVLVDGGVLWNYPIDLFDDACHVELNAQKTVHHCPVNAATLGLRVDCSNDPRRPPPHPAQVDGMKDYLMVLAGLVVDMANKVHLKPADWQRTIYIDTGNIRATDFDLKPADITRLLESGERAAERYLLWFFDPNEKPLHRIVSDLGNGPE